MLRIDIRLHLEDEAGDFRAGGIDRMRQCRLRPRAGREIANAAQEFAHAEIVERRAEEHRRHVALAIGFGIEALGQAARHLDFVAQPLQRGFGKQFRQLRIVEAGATHRLGHARMLAAIEQQQRVVEKIVGAEEIAAHADRPARRHDVQGQFPLDFVEQVKRIARFAIHLVDEGDDRHVAQPAHLEELQGLGLDAARRVEHHHRAVDGGQRAISVLAEILMARRIEQVEGEAVMLEAHHRRADRDAALLLDLHPVGARPAAIAARLHLAGKLDRAAEQQELLGERGLAGVGVGNDRESAPSSDFGGELGHER